MIKSDNEKYAENSSDPRLRSTEKMQVLKQYFASSKSNFVSQDSRSDNFFIALNIWLKDTCGTLV